MDVLDRETDSEVPDWYRTQDPARPFMYHLRLVELDMLVHALRMRCFALAEREFAVGDVVSDAVCKEGAMMRLSDAVRVPRSAPRALERDPSALPCLC
jgi:hypothetical protein